MARYLLGIVPGISLLACASGEARAPMMRRTADDGPVPSSARPAKAASPAESAAAALLLTEELPPRPSTPEELARGLVPKK